MANVLNLNIPELLRTRITINGDENKFIELNLSDITIVKRLEESYEKLNDLALDASKAGINLDSDEEITDEQAQELANILLNETDKKMRDLVDYVFDYPVSDVVLSEGSMFDPVNGNFKFEIIIESLFGLYEKNLAKEAAKIRKNVHKHTDKYLK